jgi:amidase
MDPGVLPLCETALTHFQTLGVQVEAMVPEFNYDRLWTTWLHLRGLLQLGTLGEYYRNPKTRPKLKPEAQWEAEQGQGLTATDLHTATVWRTRWYQHLLQCFDNFDYLVLPSAQTFPFAAELTWPTEVGGRPMDTYHRWMEVTLYASLAGLPVICLPAGFSEAGLPMGLQVIGRPRDELSLLQLAQGWHQAAPFMGRRSPRLMQA